MICEEVIPILSQYHAGELTETEAFNVKRHLDTCSLCQEEYRLLETIDWSLRTAERISMPRRVELHLLTYLPLKTIWEPPMYFIIAAGILLGLSVGGLSFVVNAEWFDPAMAGFNTLVARFWAWAGYHLPEIPYFQGNLPQLSVFHMMLILSGAIFTIYKIIDFLRIPIMGTIRSSHGGKL
jgi:hypothetical protein